MLRKWLSVGTGCGDVRKLGVVDVIGLDVLAVSVLFVEPKAVLVELSLDTLKRLLALGIDVGTPSALWLVEVVVFVPNTALGVEGDIPNRKGPVVLCEGSLTVEGAPVPKKKLVLVKDEGCAALPQAELVLFEDEDCAAVPKAELILVEENGCTAAVEVPVAVVRGVWVSEGEGLV